MTQTATPEEKPSLLKNKAEVKPEILVDALENFTPVAELGIKPKVDIPSEAIPVITTTDKEKRVIRKVILKVNRMENEHSVMPKDLREYRQRISSEIKMLGGIPTTDCIKGLTKDQEEYLLPQTLGMRPHENGWQARVRDFWLDRSFIIEGEKTLNASATIRTITNSLGQSVEIEVPDNLDEYINWGMAMESSKVAKTKMEKDNSSLYAVIMDDTAEIERKQIEDLSILDAADLAYVNLIRDSSTEATSNKIDWILAKIKQPSENYYSASPEIKKLRIRRFKDENPTSFIKELKNPNLEAEALINTGLNEGVISLDGTTYFFGLENLGTYAEAVHYVGNANTPEKTMILQKLKSTLKVATGKKIK
jgi:hypothetical protein